jgi:predicted permease
MSWLRKSLRRLAFLFRRNELHAQLDEEMQFHLEMQVQANRKAGMTAEDARYAAARRFGNQTLAREASREFWGWTWLDRLGQDLRYALRTLRANPGFTAAAVLTLALGIGANTAVFTLVNATILRMLPVKNPEELVVVRITPPHHEERLQFSYPFYRDVRDRNTVLAGLATFWPLAASLSREGVTEYAKGLTVTGNYFSVLGVAAASGRLLTPEDDRVQGAHPVCVISHRLWRQRFGGDPAIVGATVLLNAYKFTVVGVTSPSFQGGEPGMSTDFYAPMMMYRTLARHSWDILSGRKPKWLPLIGRMKPGITMAQARAGLQATVDGIARDIDKDDGGRVAVVSGSQGMGWLRREAETGLTILGTITALLLVIACANVAALLLARGSARRREIAVRLSIGAARGRVVRQLLTESLVLAAAGGACGVFVAWIVVAGLMAYLSSIGNGLFTLDTRPDWLVLAFLSAVVAAATLLFGLVPALHSSRVAVTPVLKDISTEGRGGRFFLRRTMVAAQVALCVVLLTVAGLFIRSLTNIRAIETGLRPDSLVLAAFNPQRNGYAQTERDDLNRRLLERVRALGAVQSASLSSITPLSGANLSREFLPEGYEANNGESRELWMNGVTPGYFKTMGIRLLAGRDFDERDRAGAQPVAVVNEALAKRFWPAQNPIGKRVRWGDRMKNSLEVVGVVRKHKYSNLQEGDQPVLYTALAQGVPYSSCSEACSGDTVLSVRTSMEPAAMIPALRAEIRALDRNLPVYDIKTMAAQLDESITGERLLATLSGAFGGLALLLAAIGLYGVIAYSVARRIHEIGIRMALGAAAADVLRLVMRDSVSMVGIGLVIGLPAAWFSTKLIGSFLYGLTPHDLGVYAAAAAMLAVVALLAAWLPARRATRVAPASALRCE